jgi:hypothetical protein
VKINYQKEYKMEERYHFMRDGQLIATNATAEECFHEYAWQYNCKAVQDKDGQWQIVQDGKPWFGMCGDTRDECIAKWLKWARSAESTEQMFFMETMAEKAAFDAEIAEDERITAEEENRAKTPEDENSCPRP